MVMEAPAAKFPIVQVTRPLVSVHVPLDEIFTSVVPIGSESVTITPVAFSGPVLLTVSV